MTALVAITPGPMVSLQDLGRPGLMADGIPESGAMDGESLMLANRLVGNAPGEPCLEFAMFGGRFRLEAAARLAITGGDFQASVDGQVLSIERTVDVPAGAVLDIGSAHDATWGYIAIAGGFDLTPVLGSCSTHLRFGIGPIPRALAADDRLPLKSLFAAPAGPIRYSAARRAAPQARAIRVVLGPQDDHFTEAALDRLLSCDFRLSAKFDRMACRLDGPSLEHRDGADIVSDGVAYGSIQVPGDGQPLVLLADRQTTGGYPKIATVISADLCRLVQRRPGDRIRFIAVDTAEAEDAWRRCVRERDHRLDCVRTATVQP